MIAKKLFILFFYPLKIVLIKVIVSLLFRQAISLEYHWRHSTCLRRVRVRVRAHGLFINYVSSFIRGIKSAPLLRAHKRHVKVTVRKKIFGFIKPRMITSRLLVKTMYS